MENESDVESDGGDAQNGGRGGGKQRAAYGQSDRAADVKKREITQIRGLFSSATQKATECEGVQDWMLVTVNKDGSVLSQSSRMFESFCSSKTGLAELVRKLSNRGTDENKEAKKDILKDVWKGLDDAWAHMDRGHAVSLFSGLGVRLQMKKEYESGDVPEHMRRFMEQEHYIDLGGTIEKGEGGSKLGERAGNLKIEPHKLLNLDSFVAGEPPSSEDPRRYKTFPDILRYTKITAR